MYDHHLVDHQGTNENKNPLHRTSHLVPKKLNERVAIDEDLKDGTEIEGVNEIGAMKQLHVQHVKKVTAERI
jgi:hypothetical protein